MTKNQKIGIGVGVGVAAIVVMVFIFRKQLGRFAKKTFKGYTWFEEGLDWYRDSKTKDGVANLHPDFQYDIKEFFSWVEKETDWNVVWSSGYRTFEHQARLKEQNSNNASAGKSNHNYGFAVDINIRNKNTGEQLKKASSKSKWLATGIPQKAKAMGMIWGGDFNSYHDPIHFEKANIPTTTEMLALHNAGKVDSNGYIQV
jgi:hypothetical protein